MHLEGEGASEEVRSRGHQGTDLGGLYRICGFSSA